MKELCSERKQRCFIKEINKNVQDVLKREKEKVKREIHDTELSD